MLSNHSNSTEADPFTSYSRSLHDYTLRLWSDSIRDAEGKTRTPAELAEAETREGAKKRAAAKDGKRAN